jgi:hypothetical protein
MPQEWNIARSAIIGAAVGLTWGILKIYVFDAESVSPSQARLIGNLVGSAIGGAFLFALVAGARNAFVRKA